MIKHVKPFKPLTNRWQRFGSKQIDGTGMANGLVWARLMGKGLASGLVWPD
jgi:hypothetical protein